MYNNKMLWAELLHDSPAPSDNRVGSIKSQNRKLWLLLFSLQILTFLSAKIFLNKNIGNCGQQWVQNNAQIQDKTFVTYKRDNSVSSFKYLRYIVPMIRVNYGWQNGYWYLQYNLFNVGQFFYMISLNLLLEERVWSINGIQQISIR